MASLLGNVSRMEAMLVGTPEKSETMLLAEDIGFLATSTWVVTFFKGDADIITSLTGTPLQITPARHRVHGLVPVILPELMYPSSHIQEDCVAESAVDMLF
jgi:hypothetical protein